MKYFPTLLIILFFVLWSCEKDDICSGETESTPKLILRFYNNNDPTVLKKVNKILVHGIGSEYIVEDLDGTVNRDSIALPLKTNALETSFSIYKNYSYDDNGTPEDPDDDIIGGNEDIIKVNYNIDQVYVSRACGYKTIFTEVIIEIEDDGNNWISGVQSISEDFQNVENERAAHYKIFH